MKPYYEDASVRIYHGDCREIMRDIADMADCIIADPPYAQTSLAWDRWPTDWPDYAVASLLLTGSMWCFGSLRMFMERATQFTRWQLAQDVVWEKHNGSSFHADRFKRVHEQAAQFYRVGSQWENVYKNVPTTPDATARTVRRKRRPPHMGDINESHYTSEDGGPRLMRSVIYARSCHGRAVNETQKPEEIIAPLIESSCPPGGLVLSPFAGSGTDGVVAKALGRRAVLIEMREEQCEQAALRVSGGPLFRAVAPMFTKEETGNLSDITEGRG